jgi:predicted NBD/HSP70 family sugar kinase
MRVLRSIDSITSEQAKRHRLLQQLHRRGEASRLHLARELRISNSRVCDLVDNMVGEGLIHEDVAAGERRGRRGVSIRLNPRYGHLVGFDIEAQRMRLVLTDFTGQVVWKMRRAMPRVRDRNALLQEIGNFLDDGMKEVRLRTKRILGVGLAASGVIDLHRGVVLHYDLIPHMVDVPLRDFVSDRVGMPCVMENNIRGMTVAEWTMGAAKGLESFVCLAVRSGIGAGVVINGRLLPGSHGFAGELGYMVITGNGGVERWRNFQQTASEFALEMDIEGRGFDLPEPILRRTGELIGAQIASIATVIDPQAFVLGGTVLKPDGPVWPHVLRAFKSTALREIGERVPLIPAQLGPFAAAQGAAYRCLYELFPVAPAFA